MQYRTFQSRSDFCQALTRYGVEHLASMIVATIIERAGLSMKDVIAKIEAKISPHVERMHEDCVSVSISTSGEIANHVLELVESLHTGYFYVKRENCVGDFLTTVTITFKIAPYTEQERVEHEKIATEMIGTSFHMKLGYRPAPVSRLRL